MQAGSSSDSGKAETGGNEAVTIVKDEAIATSLLTKVPSVVKERGIVSD
jgi:hypothetical protein